MARRLQMAPEAQAALDELTRAYGGTLPARLTVFWVRGMNEGGSVQIADPTTPTGQFEIPVSELAEGNLEQWILGHPALGGSRSYRLLVFLPKPDGTYANKPNRAVTLNYVDPAENQAAVEASRAAQAAATIAAAGVAADAVMDAAQGAVAGVAARSEPDVAAKLQESLSQFATTMGSVMSTVSRFQTPLQAPAQAAAPQPGVAFYPPMPPAYGPPGYPSPYPPAYPPAYPPPFYPQAPATAAPAGVSDKMLEAFLALASRPAPVPQTDPAIAQLLARVVERLDRLEQAPRNAGPSPELVAMQQRLEAAEKANNEARIALQAAIAKSDQERRDLEYRQQIAELKAKLEGGPAKPDAALEFLKIQQAQQAESQKMVAGLLEKMQQQSNEFNRELRELANAPAPDQSAQMRQMAQAMGEVSNTAMGIMSQAVRMGFGGQGGESQRRPPWAEPAERMIGILAGLGQSIMQGAVPPPEPPPEPESQVPAVSANPARPRLAAAPPPAPQLPPAAGPESQPPQAPPTPPPPPSREEFVRRARQLAQGSDFIGAIRTLRGAFRVYPDLVADRDEIRVVATMLDGIEWPASTTADAIEGAYVAVYGEPVREHLARLVAEERSRQSQPEARGEERPADDAGEEEPESSSPAGT